ncbi:argonaute 2-like protein, partial [Tanacetum coccineum]
MSSLLERDAMHVPFDELQALNVVMKSGLFVEKVSVARGYYPTKHRREDGPHCGVSPFRGLQQSLMAAKIGLALCVDHSAVPFRKKMCVHNFLIEYIPEIQDISDISRFRDKVHIALRGLRVSVTLRPTKETYIVSGLTERATVDICFELKDNTSGKKGILIEYYWRKWNRNIVHWSIPCLKLGRGKKPNYVPMEFCVLVNDTSFPKEILGTEASRKLKEVSLLSPDVRRSEISRMVHDEYAICCRGHSAKVLESFKVEVGINMTEVIGRVMEPPRLKIGDNHTITGHPDNRDWELFSREPVFMGKAAKRWALINCSWASGNNKLNVEAFIQKLRDCCTGMEVQMENPLVVRETCMSELSNLSKVRALLSSVIEESGKIDKEPLQLVFCVMADRGIGYGYLKWVSEAEIGVLTQCCLSENASKASSQFLANL